MSESIPAKRELELKLRLPREADRGRIVDAIRARGYVVEEREPVVHDDLYLDTFEGTLRRAGWSLRLRRSGGSDRYTLKSLGVGPGGMADREEIDVPADRPVSDTALIAAKALRRRVEEMIRPRRLIEQALVHTERRPYDVATGDGSRIELVFDSSSFAARGFNRRRSAARLLELEAELVSGGPGALAGLAAILRDEFGLQPSAGSKYETALERLRIEFPPKTPPPRLRVVQDDRFDAAVNKILAFQMDRFERYLPGARADIDIEFVHQARVATRRMRSALRLFRGAVTEKTSGYLEEELRWLGSVFGDVRDLDVFLHNLESYGKTIERAPRKKLAALSAWVLDHRRPLLERLTGELDSARLERFRAAMRRQLEKPPAKRPRTPLARRTVREAAPAIITKRYEAVIRQGRKVIARPKLKNFHALRIQIKKLRYACEFMGPAWGERVGEFIGKTVRIQDCLGELQDTVFTREFIDHITADWKGKVVDPDMLFMLGEIYQYQGEIARLRIDSFAAIWAEFDRPAVAAELAAIFAPPGAP